MLLLAGYTVLEAANGPEAIALIGQCRDRVDLLLTDIVMPDLDGIELLELAKIEDLHHRGSGRDRCECPGCRNGDPRGARIGEKNAVAARSRRNPIRIWCKASGCSASTAGSLPMICARQERATMRKASATSVRGERSIEPALTAPGLPPFNSRYPLSALLFKDKRAGIAVLSSRARRNSSEESPAFSSSSSSWTGSERPLARIEPLSSASSIFARAVLRR